MKRRTKMKPGKWQPSERENVPVDTEQIRFESELKAMIEHERSSK